LTEEGRLGAALAVARRQLPTEARLAALADRLTEAGAALPASLRSPDARVPPPVPSAPRAKILRLTGLGVGIALLGVGMVALRSGPTAVTARGVPPAPPGIVSTPSSVAASSPKSAPPSATAELAPATGELPNGTPGFSAAASLPSQASASATAAELEPPRVGPSNEQRAPAHVSAHVEPNASASLRKTPPSSSSAVTSSPQGAPLGAAATPEPELELLKQARSTLVADPARALALSEQCAVAYPKGALAQERDFIAISALARLGRTREARWRAERFRSQYPRSAYLTKLESLLESP
jgi:hypothetical protein